jgi:hypothetical protein
MPFVGHSIRSHFTRETRDAEADSRRRHQPCVAADSGKGNKDRVTPLAVSLTEPLREHLEKVRAVFEADRRNGVAGVLLPFALERKYAGAAVEWPWQWLFPAQVYRWILAAA